MIELNDHARATNPGMIKVIGIGQSLRGDDSAGLDAVRLWQEQCQSRAARPNVLVELSELPGIGLLSLLEGSKAGILVDAVKSGAAPGTIHQLSEGELAAFTEGSSSAHGWGVAETIILGRQLRLASLPEQLILIGIEVSQVKMGEILSPEVQKALPGAVQRIEQCVIKLMTNAQA